MKSYLLSFMLFAAATLRLAANDAEASTIKLSRPDQPATVRLTIQHGSVKVLTHDATDTVIVHSDLQPERPKEATRPDGLRVISSGSASFSFEEKDNVVTIEYGRDGGFGAPSDFTVHVPKNASVTIHNRMGGEISVQDLSGDVEIKSMQGEIDLKDLSGGALVETMNGEIRASFRSLAENKPLSFTSMNGAIHVHVPQDAKANVRFRTQNGSILTDFDEGALKTKTEREKTERKNETARRASEAAREAAREAAEIAREVAHEIREAIRESNGDDSPPADAPRPPRAPRPPSIPSMFGGKVIAGSLNGGGSELQAATMNGDIIVRKYSK